MFLNEGSTASPQKQKVAKTIRYVCRTIKAHVEIILCSQLEGEKFPSR